MKIGVSSTLLLFVSCWTPQLGAGHPWIRGLNEQCQQDEDCPDGYNCNDLDFCVSSMCCGNQDCPAGRRCKGQESTCSMQDDNVSARGVCVPSCFSAVTTVNVLNEGKVTMKDLKVGDKVLVEAGKYETVYAFDHLSTTEEAEFLQFHTSSTDKHPLEMTPTHMVYLHDNPNPVTADSVKVGDHLQLPGQVNKAAKIEKIKKVVHFDGVYSPQTPSGKLIVNGIACSTYSSLDNFMDGMTLPIPHHQAIHVIMAPVRVLCMGVSSAFCKLTPADDRIGLESFTLKGFKVFKRVGFPVIFALLLFLVSLPFYLVEAIFGPSLAPLAVISIGALVLWAKNYDQICLPSEAKKWQKLLMGKSL